MTPEALKRAIIDRARHLGFAATGFATADADSETAERLATWLADGHHGDMGWIAERPERRASPQGLWPHVRSVILLGLNYGPEQDPLATLAAPDRATLSLYARRRDYHETIKGRLKELAGFIVARGGGDIKVFVDTAPVMEKPLAMRAGLGWQGKNTMLVSKDAGSWLFLGAIYTTLALPPDEAGRDSCGSCTRCLDVCPTKAFPAPYVLDARRCIAYLTIEHAGTIPAEFRAAIGNRVFGCDDCLAVCPWNKFAEASRDQRLALKPELDAPDLATLAALDDAAFRAMFAGTPVKRTGRDRVMRNVLIAIGNSGRPDLAAAAVALLGDPAPIVRAMAVWAAGRLVPAEDFAVLAARHAGRETDSDVQAEWTQALADQAACGSSPP